MSDNKRFSERDSEEEELAPLDPSLGLFATGGNDVVDDLFGDFGFGG